MDEDSMKLFMVVDMNELGYLDLGAQTMANNGRRIFKIKSFALQQQILKY